VKVEHNNNFDLIRLFAALQVLQFHGAGVISLPGTPDWLTFLLRQFPGVTVFFIVSGFLVTWSYLYGTGGLAAYFARRALRIYPALWVNVCLILVLLMVSGSLSATLSPQKFLAWIAITFAVGSDIYGNYLTGSLVQPDGFYKFFPSGVLWTIPVELGFYVLLPVILLRKLRSPKLAWLSIAGWIALSLTVLTSYVHLSKTAPAGAITKLLSINPLTDLWIFLLGALVAVYWNKLRPALEGRFLFWFAIYLAIAIVEYWVFGVSDLNMHTATPLMPVKLVLLAGAVISFAFTWRNLASVLRGTDLSYGIYLYHMQIILTLAAFGIQGQGYLWLVVLGGTIGLAALSWFLIERPALRLKSRTNNWLARNAGLRVQA
jgi:peptidoglycan/LPS O-acetylase OafA/YrhL